MALRFRTFPVLASTSFVAALLLHAPSCALNTYGTEAPGGSKVCTTSANCDDGNPCTDDRCSSSNVCEHAARVDGTVLSPVLQTTGDCKIKVCSAGQPVEQNDDQDKLASNDSCTVHGCNAGEKTVMVQEDGATCTQSNATGTCKMGTCTVLCGPTKPCDDGNVCTDDACDGATGTCTFASLDGLPTPGAQQKAGDCKQQLCVQGNDKAVIDDTDVPVDGKVCTLDACKHGVPSNPNVPVGELCGSGKPDVCDGAGNCVACNVPADCVNLPADDECQTRTCVNHTCGQTFAPSGTAANLQKAGDCKKVVCDGKGKKTSIDDKGDVPVDNNPCTDDVCGLLGPGNPFKPLDTPCGTGLVCNLLGQCVGCNTPDQCEGTDDFCKKRTCENNKCGVSYTDAGKPLPAGQTTYDCKVIVCDGAGNANTVADSKDLPVDGNQCTKDVCTADTPSNPPEALNVACAQNGGQVCNGAGACKKSNGQACEAASPTDCLSQNCIDGYCCNSACGGACQACDISGSLGTCTDVYKGQDDTPSCFGTSVSCDGSGACKSENGQPCGSGCLDGGCVDSVCCAAMSCGECASCNTPGSAGTCTAVASGQSDDTCMAPNLCDGSGTCVIKNADGQTCAVGGDCQSGHCVDAVCCSTASCGTCQTCNGTMAGTCTDVPSGQTDDTCAAPSQCSGTGACKKANGGTCPGGNGDCQSGSCVDGYCCNTDCSAACYACNITGSEGTCSPVAQYSQDECMANHVCDDAGNCKLENGQNCGANEDCASGTCGTSPMKCE